MKKRLRIILFVFFALFFCFTISSRVSAKSFSKEFPKGYSFTTEDGTVTKGAYTYTKYWDKLTVTDASGKVIFSKKNVYDVIAGKTDFYYSTVKAAKKEEGDIKYTLYRVKLSAPDKPVKIYSGIRYEGYGEAIEYYYKGKIYFLEVHKTEAAFSVLDVKTGKREGIKKNKELVIFDFFEIYDSKIYFNDITGLREAYSWGDPDAVFDMKISVYDMDNGKIKVLKKIPLEDLDVSVTELLRDSVTYYYGEDSNKKKTVKFRNPMMKKETKVKKTSSDVRIGDVVYFGRFEQDGNKNNKKEPIEWIVLDKKEDEVLLLSKHLLVAKEFHSVKSEENIWDLKVSWADSSVRTWLNGGFLQRSFSDKERSTIVTSKLTTKNNPDMDIEGGPDTEDKVFLLSYEEALAYLKGKPYSKAYYTPSAVKQLRRFYKKHGGDIDFMHGYSCMNTEQEDGGNRKVLDILNNHIKKNKGWSWWLRSPGFYDSFKMCVTGNNIAQDTIPGVSMMYKDVGVRPAIRVGIK